MPTRMSSPVKGYVTSEYGTRNGTLHAGIDIATGGKSGDVHATFAGTVEKIVRGRKHGDRSRTNEIAPYRTGNGVIIRNPDGERQVYVHTAASSSLKVGDKVSIGTVIGTTDLSGNTTGYHCHYEEWTKSGATRNPRVSFKAFGVTPGATPVKASAPKPSTPAPSTGTASVRTWQTRQNTNGNAGLYVDGVKGTYSKAWESWVKTAQKALNNYKGVQGKVIADGDYGPGFRAQVKTVQSRNGLVADGILGNVTAAWMRKQGSNVPNRPKTRA